MTTAAEIRTGRCPRCQAMHGHVFGCLQGAGDLPLPDFTAGTHSL